jgi:hypothetical protein
MREPSSILSHQLPGKSIEMVGEEYHIDKKNGDGGDATFASYGAGTTTTEK